MLAPSLVAYRRAWLSFDLLAGVTLLAIAVPEQMATARLAGMPAITGLYAFIAGSVVFALLGGNRLLSVGADSTIAPVFAVGVATVAATGTAHYRELVGLVAVMVGVLVGLSGLFRLGWIADFLSYPVVSGLLAGIAIQIVVRQLSPVLGLPGGGTTTVGRLRLLAHQWRNFNGWALAIGVTVFVVVVVAERVDRRVPGALIGVIGSTAAVGGFRLHSHGVQVVGSLHAGVPAFGFPTFHAGELGQLMATAFTVAFLCIVQTAATARSVAGTSQGGSTLNRDLLAIGVGSVVAGVSASFAVNASPPRTAVAKASGAKSQVGSIVAAALTVAVIAASTLLQDLPLAALGAVLLFIAGRLVHLRDLQRVFRFDRLEFAVAAATTLIVGFVGIEQGVVVAVVLALAQRTRFAARPRDTLLGRVHGTDHWIPTDVGRPTDQVAGVVVYMPYAPFWYGNASYLRDRLLAAIGAADNPIHALIIDADAMSDIDYTGARELRMLAEALRSRGIAIGIARSSHLVHHDMKHSGLLEVIGADNLFATVQDAVTAMR